MAAASVVVVVQKEPASDDERGDFGKVSHKAPWGQSARQVSFELNAENLEMICREMI